MLENYNNPPRISLAKFLTEKIARIFQKNTDVTENILLLTLFLNYACFLLLLQVLLILKVRPDFIFLSVITMDAISAKLIIK